MFFALHVFPTIPAGMSFVFDYQVKYNIYILLHVTTGS